MCVVGFMVKYGKRKRAGYVTIGGGRHTYRESSEPSGIRTEKAQNHQASVKKRESIKRKSSIKKSTREKASSVNQASKSLIRHQYINISYSTGYLYHITLFHLNNYLFTNCPPFARGQLLANKLSVLMHS